MGRITIIDMLSSSKVLVPAMPVPAQVRSEMYLTLASRTVSREEGQLLRGALRTPLVQPGRPRPGRALQLAGIVAGRVPGRIVQHVYRLVHGLRPSPAARMFGEVRELRKQPLRQQ